MNFYLERDILEYYDISVICIVRHCGLADCFKTMLQNQTYFRRNGVEIILLVTGDAASIDIVSIVEQFPQLNWKVVKVHGLVSQAITNALSIARYRYILWITPCCRMVSDVVYQLRYLEAHYPWSFSVVEAGNNMYHAMMTDREILLALNLSGMKVTIDDYMTHMAYILMTSGYRIMPVPQAIVVLGELGVEPVTFDVNYSEEDEENKCAWLPIFNWEHEKLNTARGSVYAKLEQVCVRDENVFQGKYKLMALVQIRNESHYLDGLLQHLKDYCDGIILLDDGSDDNCFGKAEAPHLFLKARKRFDGYFDDLGNRNLLLELAHLFTCDWFFFIDADERFEGDREELYGYAERKDLDSIVFPLINLWDSPEYFRVNIPENEGGIIKRFRMFRSHGYMQITAERELHFPATPFRRKPFFSRLLIKHYGLMDALVRSMKYDRYLRQDGNGKKQGYSYDYLIDRAAKLRPVTEAVAEVNNESSTATTPSHA